MTFGQERGDRYRRRACAWATPEQAGFRIEMLLLRGRRSRLPGLATLSDDLTCIAAGMSTAVGRIHSSSIHGGMERVAARC